MAILTSGVPVDSAVASLTRAASSGLADFALRSLGGGAAAADGPPPPTHGAAPTPAPAPANDTLLRDLSLPASLRSWLKPAAELLGLTLEDGVARDNYGRIERRVTYLTNGELRRTLLHIAPKVLNDANAYNDLGMVMWALEEKSFVAVFATELTAPLPVNANVIDVLWKRRPMDSRFIAWPFVSELPLLDLVDQVEFVRTRLGLETLQPRTPTAGAGAGELTVKDIDRIVAILSLLEHFNDARGRKTLLMQAGLIAFANDVNLEGAPKMFGVDLVWRLAQHQDRVPPDNHTALGALLRTAMAIPDIPSSDGGWLKALIARCAL